MKRILLIFISSTMLTWAQQEKSYATFLAVTCPKQ